MLHEFNVKNFISNIGKKGVAYPFLYEIQFGSLGKRGYRSPLFGQQNREMMELINARLEAVSFPPSSIASKGHVLLGIQREMPYMRLYEGEISLIFLETSDYDIRKAFTEWQERIIDSTTFTHGYYDEYVTTMTVDVYNRKSKITQVPALLADPDQFPTGPTNYVEMIPEENFVEDPSSKTVDDVPNPNYSVLVKEVFPKEIKEINLSAGSQELIKTEITMAYRTWTENVKEDSKPSASPVRNSNATESNKTPSGLLTSPSLLEQEPENVDGVPTFLLP